MTDTWTLQDDEKKIISNEWMNEWMINDKINFFFYKNQKINKKPTNKIATTYECRLEKWMRDGHFQKKKKNLKFKSKQNTFNVTMLNGNKFWISKFFFHFFPMNMINRMNDSCFFSIHSSSSVDS